MSKNKSNQIGVALGHLKIVGLVFLCNTKFGFQEQKFELWRR